MEKNMPTTMIFGFCRLSGNEAMENEMELLRKSLSPFRATTTSAITLF